MRKTIRAYDAGELDRRKTLAVGQCCDLKVETTRFRVWLCRSPEAPDDHRVNYEALYQGRWLPCNPDGTFR